MMPNNTNPPWLKALNNSALPVAHIEQAEAPSPAPDEHVEPLFQYEAPPPLATLLRIARGLKVTIHYFFEEEDNSQKLMITHSDAIPPGLQRVSSGDQRPYTYHSLAQGLRHKHMEPFLIEIDNTTWHDSLLFSHEGEEEFLYVLDGEVELHYGDGRYSLKQGDSAYYDSGIHHGLVATGLSQARVVAVLYST
jgi:mannose-6-phosphate isomerase-like protein (cupin superfamily)